MTWKRNMSTGSRAQATFLPSAANRRFTKSAMGPVGAWLPGIHLGYTRSNVCADGEATGKDSRADRIFLEIVVASTSKLMVDGFSCGRATVADKTSPSHHRQENRGTRQTRCKQRKGNSLFTPAGFPYLRLPYLS